MQITIIIKFLQILWINVIKQELQKLAESTESPIDDMLIEIVDKLLQTEV